VSQDTFKSLNPIKYINLKVKNLDRKGFLKKMRKSFKEKGVK
jgi:hypothetical protein